LLAIADDVIEQWITLLRLLTSVVGPSRHFAAAQQTVALGAIATKSTACLAKSISITFRPVIKIGFEICGRLLFFVFFIRADFSPLRSIQRPRLDRKSKIYVRKDENNPDR
jgi:hypothetical protein